MKTLVAYFSAGGTTRNLALKMAHMTGSDIFEIKPEPPYTEKDLNWRKHRARCNQEHLKNLDVPVVGAVENLDQYDMIFLGFPIWYECAPNIINTFCKGYDWTGKTVALFATSGGSGIGKTVEKLQPYMKGASIVHTQVMHGTEEVK